MFVWVYLEVAEMEGKRVGLGREEGLGERPCGLKQLSLWNIVLM